MSSDIDAICASNDGDLLNINLLLKKLLSKIFLYGLIFSTEPLCFNNPSNVSIVRFKPKKL